MSEVTEEFEASTRSQMEEQLKAVVPRELLPNGGYAPLPGIYDVGWKAWMDMPAADFVKDMRKFDDGMIKENRDILLRLAPLIEKGELTREQLKFWELENFLTVDSFPVKIVANVFNNLENREIKDIILRHTAEEVGHGELKADFLVKAFGLDRVKEVWHGKPLISKRVNFADSNPAVDELRKVSPALAYATIPFCERTLPMLNQIMGRALRNVYGFPDGVLGFYDLHTYVDIYHERLGLYIMAKYGTNQRVRELFRDAVEAIRRNHVETYSAGYEAIRSV